MLQLYTSVYSVTITLGWKFRRKCAVILCKKDLMEKGCRSCLHKPVANYCSVCVGWSIAVACVGFRSNTASRLPHFVEG